MISLRSFAVRDDLRAVLGGDHHGVDPPGLAVLVLDRDLALAVGPQPGEPSGLAELRQPDRQLVGQLDRHGHQIRRLVAGKAEHQALVAGALLLVQALALGDALRDVRALLAQRPPSRRSCRQSKPSAGSS